MPDNDCGGTGICEFDAVHAAVMLNHEIKWVATYDAGFSGIPGIRRMKLSH